VTVADLGCGYGALFGFLDERLGRRLASYAGYDINEAMLAAARDHVRDPRARFAHASQPDEVADYAFASGLFNVKLEVTDDEWESHVRATLELLFDSARRAIAFNAPTTHVDWREPRLYYADPVRYFEWARVALSPQVALLHDYPLFEWTMIVRVAS
jgi:SAM-dependent methyltransferase